MNKIAEFRCINREGLSLKLNPGVGVDKFAGNNINDILSFWRSEEKGVKWFWQGKSVEILEPKMNIDGYPTADFEKVIAVYPVDHPLYPSPYNAVIFNGDGTLHKQLQVPKLVSDLAKQRAKFMNYKSPLRLFFDQAKWARNSNGEIVTALQIGFERDWWEEREIDPITGEFGECLTSGRR